MMRTKLIVTVICAMFSLTVISQTKLKVGTANADITPKLPVALNGQMHLRVATVAETPLSAGVLAIESMEDGKITDMAVMVSCDLSFLPHVFIQGVRNEVHRRMPEINVNKIVLNATHTHTGPVIDNGTKDSPNYAIPKGVLQVDEFRDFFVERVSTAIVEAWKKRSPASVSWGLGQAVVGYNRRPVYTDGTARMYGNTNTPEFLNIEGTEDHDVNVLFFWNNQDKLIATAINLSCPAQEVENDYTVNADYWHPVRESLKKRFGNELCIVGWTSAAGDISTRPMYRKPAEERMAKLRNLTRLEEMGRRVVVAVEDIYETVKDNRYSNIPFIHKVETISLPMWVVTEEEYQLCKAEVEKVKAQIAADPKAVEFVLSGINWNQSVLDRYENQKSNPNPELKTEIHVIRMGDVAICTNEFELYTDFGIRIQARSNALQTFTVQLAGPGTYLPTGTAVRHGSYGAIAQSCTVAPEGGQVLVNRTVELINEMFPKE